MAGVVSLFAPANPVDVVDLSNNSLTQVPSNLPQSFPQAKKLSLAKNQITSIGSGQLTLAATVTSLDVSSNNISSIATNALPGPLFIHFIPLFVVDNSNHLNFYLITVNYAANSQIKLGSNKLTTLDQSVFQSILQSFASGNFVPALAFIDASSSEFY